MAQHSRGSFETFKAESQARQEQFRAESQREQQQMMYIGIGVFCAFFVLILCCLGCTYLCRYHRMGLAYQRHHVPVGGMMPGVAPYGGGVGGVPQTQMYQQYATQQYYSPSVGNDGVEQQMEQPQSSNLVNP